MGEHTPGPWDCWDMDEFGWHVFATKFGSRERGQDCRLSIAAVRHGRSYHEAADNYHEQVANARLIAAAPDMLAALIAVDQAVSRLQLTEEEVSAMALVDTAIAKATGAQGAGG